MTRRWRKTPEVPSVLGAATTTSFPNSRDTKDSVGRLKPKQKILWIGTNQKQKIL